MQWLSGDEKEDMGDRHCSITGSEWHRRAGYSTYERFAIIKDARERYIEKYGVDPANPKVDVVDGVPLPKEEVERLVKSGKIKDLGHAEPLAGILGGPPGAQIFGVIHAVESSMRTYGGHNQTKSRLLCYFFFLSRWSPIASFLLKERR